MGKSDLWGGLRESKVRIYYNPTHHTIIVLRKEMVTERMRQSDSHSFRLYMSSCLLHISLIYLEREKKKNKTHTHNPHTAWKINQEFPFLFPFHFFILSVSSAPADQPPVQCSSSLSPLSTLSISLYIYIYLISVSVMCDSCMYQLNRLRVFFFCFMLY